jgi:hypothetical protein
MKNPEYKETKVRTTSAIITIDIDKLDKYNKDEQESTGFRYLLYPPGKILKHEGTHYLYNDKKGTDENGNFIPGQKEKSEKAASENEATFDQNPSTETNIEQYDSK